MLEQSARSPDEDWAFLSDPAVRSRMDRVSKLTFSDYVVGLTPEPPPLLARLSTAARDVRARRLAAGKAGAKRPGFPVSSTAPEALWCAGADVYLKFKDLDHAWRLTCDEHGWPHRGDVPLFNETAGRPADYRPYLTNAAAKRPRAGYRAELRAFGYTIESAAAD